jgi:hypothetical protein
MKKRQIGIFIIFLLILTGCSGERWEGYVYPDKSKLLIHRNAGKFKSLEECKNASHAMLESLNALDQGYYECGKNCNSESDYYNRNCEQLMRFNIYK